MRSTLLRSILLFVFGLSSPLVCHSAASNLAFRHILPDQLESIGYINAVAQGPNGFMWFGGNNGLARYDGYDITIYRHALGDPNSLSNNYVNEILVTQNGVMWVGTGYGLNRYEPLTDNFTVYHQPSNTSASIAGNDIKAIMDDSKGRLWLGTRGGLYLFIEDQGVFTRYFYEAFPKHIGTSMVWALAEDQDGFIWIGNQTGGLSRFDPNENTFFHYRHDSEDENSLSHNDVRSLYVDKDNDLWVGTYGGGLNRFASNRKAFERLPFSTKNKSETVWSILEDPLGRIWVGDGGGLNLLDPDTLTMSRFYHQEGSDRTLGNHVVNDLFLDRAGDLWVGFFPSGVDLVDGQASVFRNFTHNAQQQNTIADGGLLSAYEDSNANLWLGAGYGLSHLDVDTNTFTNYRHLTNKKESLSGDTILSIKGDGKGLWLGIWGAGLDYFNLQDKTFKHYLASDPSENRIRGKEPWSMIIGSDGLLWFVTEEGLNSFDPDSETFAYYLPPPSLVDNEKRLYARAILEDRDGRLWVGANKGLFLFDRELLRFQRYDVKAGLSANVIRTLYHDKAGYLWIGTEGGGLNKMDIAKEQFTAYRAKDGLPDEVVTSIVEDDAGKLWLGTHKGLVRFDPKTGAVRAYDRRHGLPGNLFNRDASIKMSTGELVFGSSEGLTIFNPADIWENDYVPPVVITGVSVFNEPRTVQMPDSAATIASWKLKKIDLSYEDSVFSISFAALNYRSSLDNEYAYMLEGFDEDWQYVGKNRIAYYTNIDPGTYLFKVRGANNEGVWNEVPAELEIHIHPPLWRTWWAYTLYISLMAVFVYFIAYLYVRKQAYEREFTLNQRLKDLDKLKDEFLANTSHELRTPLNGIIGLSESLLDGAAGPVPNDIRKYIEMISFSGKRLANLVNDILDFSKLKNHSLQLNRKPVQLRPFVETMLDMSRPLVGDKPITLVNLVSERLPKLDADENRLQQILYNLLGNAIKFTDQGSVTVSAKLVGSMVHIDVSDTGVGIPADQIDKIFESFEQVDGKNNRKHGGTGLGLAISKRLVELHGGQIDVSSKVDFGSTFQFQIPVAR